MGKIAGKAFVIKRDDINTDMIIAAKYLNMFGEKELAAHAFEFIDEAFPKKVFPETILVAGKNFGCGSSREHAVWALTGNNVRAIIAESFARIFFQNAIDCGLLPIVLENATKEIKHCDELEIDGARGIVLNKSRKKEYKMKPYPEFIQKIVDAGGLLPYVKKHGREI